MDIIFYEKNSAKKSEEAYPLIKELAEFYLWQNDMHWEDMLEARDEASGDPISKEKLFKIEVDERDKPFFPHLPIEFSVSHSKDYWVCLFSDSPCGIDIQEMRDGKYLSIAERFYSEKQVDYVKRLDREGFYDIWTIREAFGKMTGIGFHCDPPEFLGDDKPLLELEYKGDTYRVHQLDDFDGYKCAICIKGGEFEIYEIQ